MCCIVAQVWGRVNRLDGVVARCHAAGCAVLEDLAEVWRPDHDGHPAADLVCRSHGAIKPETAFGAAMRSSMFWTTS